MSRGDPKKLKKPQVDRLRRIVRDKRRRPEMRKWAREQLTLYGYDE